jgi:pantoate--beta-alanine ligase
MQIVKTIGEIRQAVREQKMQGKRVSFVPTMGAIHAGHLSLMRLARQHSDVVVVSIYVNPEQFGPNEDFSLYPRPLEKDLEFCKKEGIDIVFTPDDSIMYGEEKFFRIEIESLNDHMDGGSRPGYFQGIVLVVNKLFNIVQPDLAVFGQKDIQQFQIIHQMVKEFNHEVELLMAPIARAEDGLALSSRNAYLTEEQRLIAPSLYRSLRYVEKQLLDGVKEPKLLLEHQKAELEEKGLTFDYLNVFSMKEMKPVSIVEKGNQYIIAGAVYAGMTRLIDNILIQL